MKQTLSSLLERADIQGQGAFHLSEFPLLDDGVALPFLKRASHPNRIHCSGCVESCLKPVQIMHNRFFIWCDEMAQLGAIYLSPEELCYWSLCLETLCHNIAAALNQSPTQTILKNRLYDLGVMNDRTLFIIKGISWDDADLIFNDSRVCSTNPLFLTLSPAPKDLPYPTMWLGQLLYYQANALTIDTARLAMHTRTANTPSHDINQFHQKGRGWRITYDNKEILLPDSKGAAYIQHLLLHPYKDISALDLQMLRNKPENDAVIPFEQENENITDLKTIKDAENQIEYLKETNPTSNQIAELELFIQKVKHKGKLKSFSTNNSKARLAVTNAIKRTLTHIEKANPTLAAHLSQSIKCGALCQYKPEKTNSWQHP